MDVAAQEASAGPALRTHAAYFMAAAEQTQGQRPSDKSRCSGDQDTHAIHLILKLRQQALSRVEEGALRVAFTGG